MNEPVSDGSKTEVCIYCHQAVVGDHKNCPALVATGAGEVTASQVPLVDPLLGKVFAEKYEIISVLGRGGMSVVYKARHKYMDRIVALKLLLEQLVSDVAAVQRFQQESKAASTLNHQNVVTVFDFGQTPNGQAYFVMDCLEGESLSECIEHEGRVELARALEIFEQICDGLDHAHKKGIIHRDLKPNNIVLLKDPSGHDQVKIVDFGIAKIIGTDGAPQQRLTQTGEIFGSPFYMSPEQCQGFPLDARSDIYSLGCLMYETLSGFPPQMGESFVATALKHINDPPKAFDEIVPSAGIPKQIQSVIFKCLEKIPKNRYSSAEQIKQALMDAALAGGIPGVRPGAVKVTAVNSAMRQTWEKLTGVFDSSVEGLAQQKKVGSFFSRLMFVIPILLLGIGFGVAFYYPGPDSDKGTPWNKLQWQFAMDKAKKAENNGNFKEAIRQLKIAENFTKGFADGETRLKATVSLQADVFGKANRFDDLYAANKRLAELSVEDILREWKKVEAWLQQLRSDSVIGDPIGARASMQAGAGRVLLTARRLHVRLMFDREEKLLRDSLEVFKALGLEQNQQRAEFDTSLANCLQVQQKLTDVRAYLQEALKITANLADLKDGEPLPVKPLSISSAYDLVRANLKIGQFDRDQSNFKQAKRELARAQKLTDAYFSHDQQLVSECSNSIADLERQLMKEKEQEKDDAN